MEGSTPNKELLARLRAQANFASYIDKYFVLNHEGNDVYQFIQIILRPIPDTESYLSLMEVRHIVYVRTSNKKNPIKQTTRVKNIDSSQIKTILTKEQATEFLKNPPKASNVDNGGDIVDSLWTVTTNNWQPYQILDEEDNYREKRARATNNARNKKLWKK